MTREEAKDYIREWCPYGRQEEIIKALEQEPILDKIRAEILENRNWHMLHSQEDIAMVLDLDALAIIKKYKAESEDNE